MSSTSNEDSDYFEARPTPREQRPRKKARIAEREIFPIKPLLSVLHGQRSSKRNQDEDDFQSYLDPYLADFQQSRNDFERTMVELDDKGQRVRPLRPYEATDIMASIENLYIEGDTPPAIAIVLRKLKLDRERHRASVAGTKTDAPVGPLSLLSTPEESTNLPVIDALYAIKTTPYSNSFLSRICGSKTLLPEGLLGVDWETRTPWMNLMEDIHDHYSFAHPERECVPHEPAPITYSTLQASQLPQIHELLERSFWAGIDVSDSLDYWPERSTVVAMYKKVVVGVAIISSPIQTYITYLAVKSGWDKAQIARTMLFYLIDMNPTRDFTLHVSANNSAMLLYNQFGFKVEGFVANFYSSYYSANSRASKNAFQLRLRHVS